MRLNLYCLRWWIAATVSLNSCAPESAPPEIPAGATCGVPQVTGRLPAALFEASGLATSQNQPELTWIIADGGAPELLAVDSSGALRGRVTINNAEKRDWESLAAARCAAGNCLYVGDIGDNSRDRKTIRVYRITEPAINATTAIAERFEMSYPDGPHDAEAIFVLPDEQLYVITKGRSEPLTVYRYPGPLDASAAPVLEQVQTLSRSFVQLPEMITGAGATADGKWIVIRTYGTVQLHQMDGAFLRAVLAAPGIDLAALAEFQGEGVDLRPDGTIVLASEKGLDEQAPPLSRVLCKLSS